MGFAEFSPFTSSHQGPNAFTASYAGRTVLWMSGEHDISTVAELSATMADAIALDDPDLVVDLSAVEFIDAATVGVIVRAHNLLGLQSRSLAVRAPSKCARRILQLCGLAHLFDPRQADATDMTPPAGVSAGRVAVRAVDSADRNADAPAPEPRHIPAPGVEHVPIPGRV